MELLKSFPRAERGLLIFKNEAEEVIEASEVVEFVEVMEAAEAPDARKSLSIYIQTFAYCLFIFRGQGGC